MTLAEKFARFHELKEQLAKEHQELSREQTAQTARMNFRVQVFNILNLYIEDSEVYNYKDENYTQSLLGVNLDDLVISTSNHNSHLELVSVKGVKIVGLKGFATRQEFASLVTKSLEENKVETS